MPSAAAAARLLEEAVLARFDGTGGLDPVVVGLVASLRHGSGPAAIGRMADDLGTTTRTLHRACTAAVGYGPKTLDRVFRFRRFLALDQSVPLAPLAQLAADAGYADQAHLTRECGRFAGATPSQLRTERRCRIVQDVHALGPGRVTTDCLPVDDREVTMNVLFVAGFSPIIRDLAAGRTFYSGALGIALEGDDYPHTENLEGVKHFGLWLLSEAAKSCFGTETWPEDTPVPQDHHRVRSGRRGGGGNRDGGRRICPDPRRPDRTVGANGGPHAHPRGAADRTLPRPMAASGYLMGQ